MKKIIIIGGIFVFLSLYFITIKQTKASLPIFFSKIDSFQISYDNQDLRLAGESFNLGLTVFYRNGKKS